MDVVEKMRCLGVVMGSRRSWALRSAVAHLSEDASPSDVRRVAERQQVDVGKLWRLWTYIHGDRVSIDSAERAG